MSRSAATSALGWLPPYTLRREIMASRPEEIPAEMPEDPPIGDVPNRAPPTDELGLEPEHGDPLPEGA
jgi:hypothetical protein